MVEERSFWTDKAFAGIRFGERERGLFLQFLESHDFRPNTLRAFSNDLRSFMLWFTCVGPLLPDCGEVSHRNSRSVIGFELIGRSVSERLVDSL